VKQRFLLPLLLAVLTLGWVGAAQPGTAVAAATCDGVWVVVDYGSLGGSSTECAASYGTGAAALKSAGFNPTFDNGMVTRIAGNPSNPDLNKYYWSYWHASQKADGSYSSWSYSSLGATAYHPNKGNAEGWRYQALSDGKVPPAASPPKATPAPTPTPTSTKATPKPTHTATKKPTPKPSATAAATTSASAKPSASATATQKAGATPTPTPTPTATPVPTPTGTDPATAEAEAQVTPAQPVSDNGSPVGAIAVGAIVVVGGAGVGGWWFLKGRRR
jgi:hypothetical protein